MSSFIYYIYVHTNIIYYHLLCESNKLHVRFIPTLLLLHDKVFSKTIIEGYKYLNYLMMFMK